MHHAMRIIKYYLEYIISVFASWTWLRTCFWWFIWFGHSL